MPPTTGDLFKLIPQKIIQWLQVWASGGRVSRRYESVIINFDSFALWASNNLSFRGSTTVSNICWLVLTSVSQKWMFFHAVTGNSPPHHHWRRAVAPPLNTWCSILSPIAWPSIEPIILATKFFFNRKDFFTRKKDFVMLTLTMAADLFKLIPQRIIQWI